MASSQARLSSSPGRPRLCEQAVDGHRAPRPPAAIRWPGRPRDRSTGEARATGEPAVVERLLGRRRPVVGAAARVRDAVAERRPDIGQPRVILRFLEPAACVEEERLELVRRARGDEEAVEGGHRAGERRPGLVAGLAGPHGRLLGDRGGSLGVVPEGLGEVELGVDVEAERPRQRERALEQPGRGALVASVERAPPRG